jgi:putative spermidine/putrescine transport system substrate-binding protein
VRIAKEKYEIGVLMEVGTPSARKTKIIAQANRPRNSMDIPFLVDSDMFQLDKQSIIRKIDLASVPNSANLIDKIRSNDYSIPIMYSALVLVYNRNKVATPPKSIADLWKKEYAGKIGVTDLSYDKIIPMASVAHGGSTSNYAPGYEALLALKKNGVRVYPSNEAVGNAFKSEEILVSIMWKGRGFQWSEAGLPVAYVSPTEGAYPVYFEMGITKNSGVPSEASRVLGCVLEPEVQRAMALAIGQVPAVKNAPIAADVMEKIGFTAADRDRFIRPDHAYAASKSSEAIEFWNQKFKG